MSSPSFPDFLVLGAPKAGTTAFCEYLQTHPHICLSQPKETRYFLLSSKWDRETYRQRFFQQSAGRMCGEGTPNYLGMSFVLPRLAEVAPSAQLFLLLRDPAERAFSSWWMRVSWSQEFLGFEQALRMCLQQPPMKDFLGSDPEAQYGRIRLGWKTGRPACRGYLHYGLYGPQLAELKKFFPQEQIHVVWSENLARNPAAVANRALISLGLDPKIRQGSLNPRWRAHGVRTAVCGHLLRWILPRRAASGRAFHAFSSLMRRLGDRPLQISQSCHRFLLDFFDDSDQILAKEVGELPPWRRT